MRSPQGASRMREALRPAENLNRKTLLNHGWHGEHGGGTKDQTSQHVPADVFAIQMPDRPFLLFDFS